MRRVSLYQIDEEQYDLYLYINIRGKLESGLDGLVLTCFRSLLVKR